MRRVLLFTGFIVLGGLAFAQSPNVTFAADLDPQVRYTNAGTRVRWWDDTGRISHVRLGVTLENGWKVRLHQKLGLISGDPDNSTIEEFYTEKPGEYRIGKIYTPFGTGRLMRENGLGGKIDAYLSIWDMPISFAVIDNGKDRQRGAIGRVGDNIGFSVAVGEHFGIGGTSLTPIRLPDQSPGRGRGYGLAYGADVSKEAGGWKLGAEYLALRNGATIADKNDDVVLGFLSYQFPYGPLVEAEGAFSTESHKESFRFTAHFPLSNKVFIGPSVRMLEGEGWVFAMSARIRL